jgi:hypothetical protein
MMNLARRQRSGTRNRNTNQTLNSRTRTTLWYLYHWKLFILLTNSSCHRWPHKHKPSSTLDFDSPTPAKNGYIEIKRKNKVGGGRTSRDQRVISIYTATHDQSCHLGRVLQEIRYFPNLLLQHQAWIMYAVLLSIFPLPSLSGTCR